MKKILILTFAIFAITGAKAQTQIYNSDFEEWETVTYKSTTCEEPKRWSSFIDGTGGLKGMAANVQLVKSDDVRPGSSDNKYCAKINTREITVLFVKIPAQGNLTTGCVNMGSTTAADASGNYNYINYERDDQAMPFTGKPTKFEIYLKGNCSQNASVAIHLVKGTGHYQEPVSEKTPNTATRIALAELQTSVTGEWTKYEGTFSYVNGDITTSDSPEYVLVNISTSSTPGKGSSSDVLYVDDLTMIYPEIDSVESSIVDAPSQPTPAYNLAGQRIADNANGIIIKAGKKYINK